MEDGARCCRNQSRALANHQFSAGNAAAKALFLLAGGLEFGLHRVHNNPFPLKKFILDAASIPKNMAKRWQVESMVLRAIKGAGHQWSWIAARQRSRGNLFG